MNPYFFIFGFGYTAQALATKLIVQGFKVIGTSRIPKVDKQPHLNVKLVPFDSPIEKYLSLTTHLLISIPTLKDIGDIVFLKYIELIKKHASHLQWIGYLSSTGVYGDHQGNWVTEESECIPHTPTGIARLKAEEDWMTVGEKNQLPLHIFRLSGIYGPKRNVLERLVQGKKQSIYKLDQVFCRIHIEDIVDTLLASIQSPNPLSVYNVSDDEPAPAYVVEQYGANLLHQPPLLLIPIQETHLSPMEQEFYSNNRRVSNLKIKNELQVVLKYPSYKEGLTHIWKNDFRAK